MKVLEIVWWGMKIWSKSWMGYEFFEEKIIFPSTPVPGFNNDQSLKPCYSTSVAAFKTYKLFKISLSTGFRNRTTAR